MKVAGSYTFEASQEKVWEALQDPTVLTGVLPGCERLEEVGDKQYEGELNIRVGPVQGKFKGRVEMRDLEPPNSFTLAVDGRGSSGFVKATAKVGLEARGDDTVMSYDSDAQVGGRIASVGQRLLDSSARAVIQQSLEGMHGIVRATRADGLPEGEPAAGEDKEEVGYRPPSQAEFAARVAGKVARDLVPRPVVIGGLILLLLVVLYLLLT